MRLFYCLLFAVSAWLGVRIENAEQRSETLAAADHDSLHQSALQLDESRVPLLTAARRHGIAVTNDAAICKSQGFMGWYANGSKRVVLCQANIRSFSQNHESFNVLLQRTLAHELVHVAQDCQRSVGRLPSLGIPAAELYALPKEALDEVERSVAFVSGGFTPRSVRWRQEAEAQALEGNPKAVSAALDAVCGS